MKEINIILNIYTFLIILNKIISSKISYIQPKCCVGSESFGLNEFSLGTSCSNMITCCPSGTHCNNEGICIKNKLKKAKRKIRKKKDINNEEDEIKPIRIEPEIVKKEEKQKKGFSGPVRINWKTLTKCLIKSKSKEPIIQEILDNYENNKESEAMKKVFSELKKNSPIIIDCLNKQEHLQ